jgi:hypothetical protein
MKSASKMAGKIAGKEPRVQFHWEDKVFHRRFATGVSLHSHTLHSRESMTFVAHATKNTPILSGAIRKQEAKYRALKGYDVNLKRAWWTPPLSGLQAFHLEKSQIELTLGNEALVSITDHDNIDAGLHLSLLDEAREAPISVEWTVPYRATFFHLGVHNLPPQRANGLMTEMQAITSTPSEPAVGAMLDYLCSLRDVLVIFNHPLWDENHIGTEAHRIHVEAFLGRFGEFIHALELNGLRPWPENKAVTQFAAATAYPLISGGDRHGREPNACINMTNATTFAGFVDEVRRDGWSDVLFMPQYNEPFRLRILQNICDIIEPDPNHSLGWTRWSDRSFYLTDEGIEKSLGELWGDRVPGVVTQFVRCMGVIRHRRVRSALRVALSEKQEVAL